MIKKTAIKNVTRTIIKVESGSQTKLLNLFTYESIFAISKRKVLS